MLLQQWLKEFGSKIFGEFVFEKGQISHFVCFGSPVVFSFSLCTNLKSTPHRSMLDLFGTCEHLCTLDQHRNDLDIQVQHLVLAYEGVAYPFA